LTQLDHGSPALPPDGTRPDAIAPATGALQPLGATPLPDSMVGIAVDRSGRWLLAAAYGADALYVFAIDAQGHVLPTPAQRLASGGTKPHAICIDAANRFVQAGADVILSGHIHLPFVTAIPFGDGKTQAVGSGTLSLRERGAAPGFNVIEVEPGCVRVAAIAYERGKFDVWRTWAFDRRTQAENENGAAEAAPLAL
jgi:3',5'-cyclic AMP phosphodiesterase CpdA